MRPPHLLWHEREARDTYNCFSPCAARRRALFAKEGTGYSSPIGLMELSQRLIIAAPVDVPIFSTRVDASPSCIPLLPVPAHLSDGESTLSMRALNDTLL